MSKNVKFRELIQIPIYDIDIEIVVVNRSINKVLSNDGMNPFKEEPDGCCSYIIDNIIRLYFFDKTISYNVITHETLHATILILKYTGIKLSSKSEEAYTYLNGFINEKVFNLLNKRKIKYK